jgi:hypothetical protein
MPKSNSALNKFNKDTPESVERRQFQELVANEFNDARSQVIKRLFEQSATYAELFDKQRTLGNTVVAFSLGKELGAFKDSIERAKVKLEENEKRPFNDVLGSYSKVISAINAYINSTGARAGEVAGLVGEIRNLAPAINDLFIEGIKKQNERLSIEGDEKGNISDNDLINIFLLFEKIQSGYAEGQTLQGINLAGVVSASPAEKERLKDHLRFSKELTLRGIARVGPERTNILPSPPTITPFSFVVPSRAEQARREADELERSSPQDRNTAVKQYLTDFYAEQYNVEKYLRDEALDPKGMNNPAKAQGHEDKLGALLTEASMKGIMARDIAERADQLVKEKSGRGKKRRGDRRVGMNAEMARTYELIHRYSGFPYFVPPSAPSSKMVNPRSRVNVNTEGSGRKKGKKSGKPKYTDI